MTIKEMQKQIFDTAVSKGWWPLAGVSNNHDIDTKQVNIPEKLALMHSELSEALEFYREGEMSLFYSGDNPLHPKPDGFWIELADCMIRIMDLAEAYGQDMESLILDKMAYNQIRPYRHGGKKC